MKVCPNCQTKYPDDANFCPQETCATPEGPRRLDIISAAPAVRYEMGPQIGGSRSGEVFRARDLQSGATVAYKRVTRAVLTSPAVIERSQRELKQLQRAQSPRLAKVLDYGKEPDGQLFVVSELADGQTLAQVVAASGPFSLDRAKKIAAQIGEALLEGQKVGVVHHDLAPKNVLVGAGDQVKVINFVAPVPVTETVFGVPEYLSPEQAEGKLVDQRSNTYSLGGILLFMLTGQPPVEGASAAAVLEQVMKGSPVPPSLRVQGLNAEVDRVVGKAMDKSPNRRPLTIRQFLTDVAGMMAVAPSTADPARGVGFAKTMMFAGGSPEAQKLVNQALAARAEANGAGSPASGAPGPNATAPIAMVASEARGGNNDPQATPPPVARPAGAEAPGPRRTHGAAIAATMVALPAAGKLPGAGAGPVGLDGGAQATPPPVAPAPIAAPVAAGGPGPAKPTGAAAFRETLWFKQGDVDQMVADARAKLDASRAKSGPAPAPEPEVGIVRFTGTVHATTHHGDRDRVLAGVVGHLLHVLGQLNEGFVLDARATGATDDIQRVEVEADDRPDSPGGDIGNDRLPRGDLFALAVVGNRQRDSNRVSDPLRNQLLEGNACLDDSIGGKARFSNPQVQRHVGAFLREPAIDFDHLCRI